MNIQVNCQTGDPRTKSDRQKLKSRTGPDQDQEKFQSLGADRTKTEPTTNVNGGPWIPAVKRIHFLSSFEKRKT